MLPKIEKHKEAVKARLLLILWYLFQL